MSRLSDQIKSAVVEAAVDAVKSGAFDDAITSVVVDTIRKGRDQGLTKRGFILKMAVEMIDCSSPPIRFQAAREYAIRAYEQFKKDAGTHFGEPGWDWSGAGARLLAHEYEIDLWEPTP